MTRLLALLTLLLALAGSAWAGAPPTERIDLARFRIHHTARAASTAAALARVLESERDGLAARMGRDWEGVTEIFVAEGPDEAQAIAPGGLQPPPWAAGIAVPSANVLLLDARVLRGDDGKQVLRHELAHLALGRMGRGDWPRWFQEGVAMLVAGEWSVARYAAMYRASVRAEAAIPLSALERHWPDRLSEVEIAYAQSFSFVSHVYEAGGEPAFRALIGRVADGGAFAEAFAAVYGRSLADEEDAWRKTLSRRYSWVPVATSPAVLWGLISLTFLGIYLTLRLRRQARLARMEL